MKGLVNIHDAQSQSRFTAYFDVPGDSSLADLLPSLAGFTEGATGRKVDVGIDGRRVDPRLSIDQVGLHEGSWISLLCEGATIIDPRVRSVDDPAAVQLRFLSGFNAGAIYDVLPGILRISSLMDPEKVSISADFLLDVHPDGRLTVVPNIREGAVVKAGFLRKPKRQLHSDVWLDGHELIEPTELDYGQELVLPECIISVTKGHPDSVPVDKEDSPGHWLYTRPPKIRNEVRNRRYTLPGSPTRPDKAPIPILSTLLPFAMSVGMAVILKNYSYLAFGIMSPVMMIASYFSGNNGMRKKYKAQVKRYEQSRDRIKEQAKHALEEEVSDVRAEYPDPTALLDLCASHSAQLWNRRATDDSWLGLRIGTGDVKSHVSMEMPDNLEFERVKTWQLHHFPVVVNLPAAGCLGCTGEQAVIFPTVQWIVAQMAALHSDRDLSIYLLSPRSRKQPEGGRSAPVPAQIDWSFAQWLPQLIPQQGQNAVRTLATGIEDIAMRISELIAMLDDRKELMHSQSMQKWAGPSVVVVMEHAHVLRSMPGTIRLLKEGPLVGMYMLCVEIDERLLPEECQTVVTGEAGQLKIRSNVSDDVNDIMPDLVTQQWLDALSLSLAPLEDGSPDESQSAIPSQSRLLDLLKLTPTPEEIEARWALQPRSTFCTIGESVDGSFGLDIAKDGPHGLIAGTTGSGKSELLQSLVASLAVANRPESLNFVLVDYKGGAAFKDCVKLPHTVGMVTDLDNHLVTRALVSLGAELNYREHLLALAGAKDLDDYMDFRELRPDLTEIPRLLIIIDEFASLARELPDFVTGLVNIAQRGRSLGIHLLLATQRPGGVVSPEIRANTNLRIALRMTDDSESQDVIDAKDASLISKSTPGRAVVRLGSNSLVPFQSARVGGRYIDPNDKAGTKTEKPFVRVLSFPQIGQPAPARPKSKENKGDVSVTDLMKLVESICEVAKDEGIPQQRQPWLPALTDEIGLDDLPDSEDGDAQAGLQVPFAIGDYPKLQKQSTVFLDMATFGNLFIIGTSRSGKTTALRTIAFSACKKYAPTKVQVYCIDGGNGGLAPLTALPNVGVVALRSEMQKIERLLNKIERVLKARSATLSKGGYSNIDEFNRGLDQDHEEEALPHMLVMLDSWDGYNSTFESYDGGSLISRMQNLMREGPSVGVHFILSGDRSLLSGRMTLLADSKIMLRLVDKTDYSEIGIPAKEVPDKMADGRGYQSVDDAEIQIAQIRRGEVGQQESEAIRTAGVALATGRDAGLTRSRLPFNVEQLPDEVSFDQVYALVEESKSLDKGLLPLGIGGEDNDLIAYDPAATPILPVFGGMQSGKTTLLVWLANMALSAGYHLVIAAPKDNALRRFEGVPGVVRVFTTPADLTQENLEPYARNGNEKALESSTETGFKGNLLMFDDCQLLKEIPASAWMQSLVGSLSKSDASCIFAGDIIDFPQGFGNWGSSMKKIKQGVLIRPEDMIYADLIGARVKRSLFKSEMPQGRGIAKLGMQTVSIQFPKLDGQSSVPYSFSNAGGLKR